MLHPQSCQYLLLIFLNHCYNIQTYETIDRKITKIL